MSLLLQASFPLILPSVEANERTRWSWNDGFSSSLPSALLHRGRNKTLPRWKRFCRKDLSSQVHRDIKTLFITISWNWHLHFIVNATTNSKASCLEGNWWLQFCLYLYITESLFVDFNVSVMNISHPTRLMCMPCVRDWLADLTGKKRPSQNNFLPMAKCIFYHSLDTLKAKVSFLDHFQKTTLPKKPD